MKKTVKMMNEGGIVGIQNQSVHQHAGTDHESIK